MATPQEPTLGARTTPQPSSVIRARYWLAAALRLVGFVVGAWALLGVVSSITWWVTSLVSGAVAVSPGEMVQWLINNDGPPVLWLVAAWIVFAKAPRVAARVFPMPSAACPVCGYKVSGLRPGTPCPECGCALPGDPAPATPPSKRT